MIEFQLGFGQIRDNPVIRKAVWMAGATIVEAKHTAKS
jgi:hypothetical protein